MSKKYDVIIVGGGPAALSAGIYLGRENYDVLIIERRIIGGTMSTISRIDNYPGLPSVSGPELSEKMWQQAEGFGVKKVTAEAKKAVSKDGIITITTNSDEYVADALIIATGGSYRKLGIPGEEYAHYCATCDGPFYKDKKLVVVGGANSALSSAVFLSNFASEVVIVARNEITADKVLQDEVAEIDNISVKKGLKIKKILAKDKKVDAVEFDGETIKTDGVFIFAGFVPSSGWVKDLDITLDEQGYIETDSKLAAAPGVFVAGDIHQGNVKQIAVAVGEGATVAKNVSEFFNS